MKYEICYAVACDTGKERTINQDNFCCPDQQYLNAINNGLDGVKSYKSCSTAYPSFAVFDGMGGEQYGEVAASIAAETFNELNHNKKSDGIKDFLITSCRKMNNNITTYAKQKLINCIGTTVAMIIFGKKEICACNIGDSRIYRYNNESLTQISKDHTIDIYKGNKPSLTQFLGIPESEFTIEPHIVWKPYNDGDYYLICSDGLTDMLGEEEIESIIIENSDVKVCVENLLENALSRGGRDNITIILCKIKRRNILSGALCHLIQKGYKYGIYS